MAPHDGAGLDWSAGMAPENVAEYTAAAAGPEAYAAYLEREFLPVLQASPADLTEAMGGLLTPVDQAALDDTYAEWLAETFRRAGAQGVVGVRDDGLACVAPWGFDLASITVPVAVWQGREDAMVPYSHGAWLAEHVPGRGRTCSTTRATCRWWRASTRCWPTSPGWLACAERRGDVVAEDPVALGREVQPVGQVGQVEPRGGDVRRSVGAGQLAQQRVDAGHRGGALGRERRADHDHAVALETGQQPLEAGRDLARGLVDVVEAALEHHDGVVGAGGVVGGEAGQRLGARRS